MLHQLVGVAESALGGVGPATGGVLESAAAAFGLDQLHLPRDTQLVENLLERIAFRGGGDHHPGRVGEAVLGEAHGLAAGLGVLLDQSYNFV